MDIVLPVNVLTALDSGRKLVWESEVADGGMMIFRKGGVAGEAEGGGGLSEER
jgi:hypothetical protein